MAGRANTTLRAALAMAVLLSFTGCAESSPPPSQTPPRWAIRNTPVATITPTPAPTTTPGTDIALLALCAQPSTAQQLGAICTPVAFATAGSPASQAAAHANSFKTIYVANTDGDGVILRSAPSMETRTSTVLAEGTVLSMAATVNGWAYIVSPAQGFIPPQYWSYKQP